MKIKNILIFGILLIALCFNVFAVDYDVNSTVPINAQYTFAGVLTHANANLTVTLPDGNVDLNANNIGLNEVTDGVFTGSYNTTLQEGRYTALVVFYNDSWVELGRDTQYFNVGIDKFSLGDNFDEENRFSLVLLLVIGLVMYLLQLIFNVPVTGLIGGIVWIFLSLSFFSYSYLFGLIILICGLAITIHSVFMK